MKLGALACLALLGCAAKAPAPAVSPADLADAQLREAAAQLSADAERTCESACVSQIIGQCVLLAVQQYEYVSEQCISDKSRACVLNCTP
jgi:hypothetical protein